MHSTHGPTPVATCHASRSAGAVRRRREQLELIGAVEDQEASCVGSSGRRGLGDDPHENAGEVRLLDEDSGDVG